LGCVLPRRSALRGGADPVRARYISVFGRASAAFRCNTLLVSVTAWSLGLQRVWYVPCAVEQADYINGVFVLKVE
jgi:hypothetical protein